jgi:hypothetical protein
MPLRGARVIQPHTRCKIAARDSRLFQPSKNLHCTSQHGQQQREPNSIKGRKGSPTLHTVQKSRARDSRLFQPSKNLHCTSKHRQQQREPNLAKERNGNATAHTLKTRRGRGQQALSTVQTFALYTATRAEMHTRVFQMHTIWKKGAANEFDKSLH